jgi:hypothetical protein
MWLKQMKATIFMVVLVWRLISQRGSLGFRGVEEKAATNYTNGTNYKKVSGIRDSTEYIVN